MIFTQSIAPFIFMQKPGTILIGKHCSRNKSFTIRLKLQEFTVLFIHGIIHIIPCQYCYHEYSHRHALHYRPIFLPNKKGTGKYPCRNNKHCHNNFILHGKCRFCISISYKKIAGPRFLWKIHIIHGFQSRSRNIILRRNSECIHFLLL